MSVTFTKMHGLGNDFVVIDATQTPFALTAAQIQHMANRRLGVGFDQLLVVEKAPTTEADFLFRIFNADASEVGQCGNGARCMAHFIRARKLSAQSQLRLMTKTGLLSLEVQPDDRVRVQMGVPHFLPSEIPFEAEDAQASYEIVCDGQAWQVSVVNVGNPHAILVVDAIDAQQVSALGAKLSTHARFPEGVNVGFMQVIDSQHIRLRVYERGTGETLACGSGACAAMVVGRRNGLLHERVEVHQPGGSLTIDWQGPLLPVAMTGPAVTVFQGEWSA